MVYTCIMEIVLYGNVPSKKNNKRLVWHGRKPSLLSSEAHEVWHTEQMYRLCEKRPKHPIEKCDVEAVFYLRDRRKRDLSNMWEGVADLLVDARYLKDDNYTVLSDVHLMFGGIDKENPRAVVRLFVL